MKVILPLLLLILAACAPNPNGVQEGQWVVHQVTGEEYFLVDYNVETGNVEEMKNSDGELVHIDTNIIELAPRDVEEEETVVDHSDLIKELRLARIALDQANTPVNRDAMEEVIEETERAVTADSPIFRAKTWNPATGRYE